MTTITTLMNDRLDRIVKRAFGLVRGELVTAILELNPHLASQPPILPAGLSIVLPPAPSAAAKTRQTVKLWE